MQLMSWRSGALAFIACGPLALAAAPVAAQQAPLLDVVHTVAGTAPNVPVPAEHTFSVSAAGTYNVKLTDLGPQLPYPEPLGSVAMAVTSGNAIVGTPLTAPGTLTFTASGAGDYVIHVVATLTAPASPPAPANSPLIGAIGIDVTDHNNNLLETFSDTLAPASSSVPNGAGLMTGSFYVQTTGSYQVTLTDLMFPQALCSPAPCTPLLTLIIIQPGQLPVTTLPGGANPVQLQAAPQGSPPIFMTFSPSGALPPRRRPASIMFPLHRRLAASPCSRKPPPSAPWDSSAAPRSRRRATHSLSMTSRPLRRSPSSAHSWS